ncbi:sensor histidine kinase [Vibrio maritimus]|uniref:sensor histidine kinase n=1 Tax=Vibrio maritimus TaxID=990268 RepID=UPI003735CB1D
MYTKKLTRLLDSEYIQQGDVASYSTLLLETLVQSLYLHDASLWLAVSNDQIDCVSYQTISSDEAKPFSPIDKHSFDQFAQQLSQSSHLVYAYNNAENAKWMGDVDVTHFRAILVPVKLHGQLNGFILLRQKPHQATPDSAAIQFVISTVFALGTTIQTAQQSLSLNSPSQRELQLEQSVKEHNEGIKEMLQNLEKAQNYQVEVEKMEALGKLVAGVAHEVNTPLGVAMTSVSIVDEQIKRLERAYQNQQLDESVFVEFLESSIPAINMTNTNLERAALLVQQFKQTSDNEGHGAAEVVSFKPLCESLIASIAPLYQPYEVEFMVDIPEALKLETIPGAVEQIFTNFINNSCQHGFKSSQEPHNLVFIKVFKVDDKVIIDYQDNGVGIDDAIAHQVFTPFYTTNRNQGGTGLGLSIVYNLVTQKLKGDIRIVEQDASIGAHFQIRLPINAV